MTAKDGQKESHQKETKENPSTDHHQRDTENKRIQKDMERASERELTPTAVSMASTESKRYRDHRIRQPTPEQRKYEKRSHAHYAIDSTPKMMVARIHEPKQRVMNENGAVHRTSTGWMITGLGETSVRCK